MAIETLKITGDGYITRASVAEKLGISITELDQMRAFEIAQEQLRNEKIAEGRLLRDVWKALDSRQRFALRMMTFAIINGHFWHGTEFDINSK